MKNPSLPSLSSQSAQTAGGTCEKKPWLIAGVTCAGLFAALAFGAAPTSAAIIAHEGFDYDRVQWDQGSTEGDGIAGLNGGVGWAGPWTQVGDMNAGIPEGEDDYEGAGARTAPLSYTDNFGNSLVTTGNQVRTAFGNNSWDRRTLSEPLGELGSTVWMSFLGQAHGLAGDNRWAFIELAQDGADRAWIGNVNPVASGNWGIYLPDRTEGALSGDAGDGYPMNEQTMFLMRIDFPEDASESTNFSVWLNPASLTDETALAAPVFAMDTDYAQYNQVGVAGRYSSDFDEIRIGSSFDSVTPVPEPSTYALILGIGIVGLAVVKRRMARRVD